MIGVDDGNPDVSIPVSCLKSGKILFTYSVAESKPWVTRPTVGTAVEISSPDS